MRNPLIMWSGGMKKNSFGAMISIITLSSAVFITLLPITGWSGAAVGQDGVRPASDRKHNVVLITVNGLRYNRLGSNGYARPTTPAIDKLAETSFVFTGAFAQAGYTMPNMMTMFTSLYPESHDVMDVYKDVLSPRVRTLADIFRENGYMTVGFWQQGIAHLDLGAGFGRGFETVENLKRNFQNREDLLGWMREKRDEPFFLMVNTRNTHPPYLPLPRNKNLFQEGKRGEILDNEEEYDRAIYRKTVSAIQTPGGLLFGAIDSRMIESYADLFDGVFHNRKMGIIRQLIPVNLQHLLTRIEIDTVLEHINIEDPENIKYLSGLYDACVLGVDQELVKPILQTLEELGIGGRTIVILTAEHGVGLGEHGILFPGTRYYEEIIRVPLIIKVPGSSERRDLDDLVQTVDLMPTILELSGIPVPAQAQGKSLVPLMEGRPGSAPNEAVIGNNRVYAFLRTREWKLVVWREHVNLPFSDKDELFHLPDDPAEKRNLRDAQRETYKTLRKRIREHLESVPRHVDKDLTYPEFIDNATRRKIRETGYW